MQNNKVTIGVVGAFQVGKSTLVNCLLDDKVARAGFGLSCTKINTKYVYGEFQSVRYYSNEKIVHTGRLIDFIEVNEIPKGVTNIEVSLWKPLLKHVNIVDTPGFNANDKDDSVALESIRNIDAAIVLLSNRKELSKSEVSILNRLNNNGIPYYVFVNCTNEKGGDSWNPLSDMNTNIINSIVATTKGSIKINDKPIWCANLWWFWYASENYIRDTIDDEKKLRMVLEKYLNELKDNIDMFHASLSHYLCDNNDDNRALVSELHKYLDEFENYNVNDYPSLVQLSNFVPFRTFFEESILGFPMNYIKWNSQLCNQLSIWDNKTNDALKTL